MTDKNEQWYLSNQLDVALNIGDLPKIPTLSKGYFIDALFYYSKDEVAQSANLCSMINNGYIKVNRVSSSGTEIITSCSDLTVDSSSSFDDEIDEALVSQYLWDDLRVSVNDVTLPSTNPPVWQIYKNNGVTLPDVKSVYFDGDGDYGTITNSLDGGAMDMTFEFWIQPLGKTDQIFHESTNWDIFIFNNDIGFAINGVNYNFNANLILNAIYHVVLLVEPNNVSGNTKVTLYLNGSEFESVNISEVFEFNSGTINVGRYDVGGNPYWLEGYLDNTIFYNVILTADQISYRYNNGSGRVTYPAGITEATDVLGEYLYDDDPFTNTFANTTSTLEVMSDMTVYDDTTQTDGLVDPDSTTQSTLGVAVLNFPSGQDSEVFFTVQLPHAYKIGTDVEAHVHWTHDSDDTGDISWGFEYTWCNIHGVWQNTSTIVKTEEVSGIIDRHEMTVFGYLDGSDKNISSMMLCRLYRRGVSDDDTFTGDAFLLEFDFHFVSDSLGSQSIYFKKNTSHLGA